MRPLGVRAVAGASRSRINSGSWWASSPRSALRWTLMGLGGCSEHCAPQHRPRPALRVAAGQRARMGSEHELAGAAAGSARAALSEPIPSPRGHAASSPPRLATPRAPPSTLPPPRHGSAPQGADRASRPGAPPRALRDQRPQHATRRLLTRRRRSRFLDPTAPVAVARFPAPTGPPAPSSRPHDAAGQGRAAAATSPRPEDHRPAAQSGGQQNSSPRA